MSRRATAYLLGFLLWSTLTGAASAQLYDLPFKGEDLGLEERVFWGRPIHSQSGVQKFGYDLDVRRYDQKAGSWQNRTAATNAAYHVYQRPVYAMRDGTVIACWRNAPENPAPGAFHEELNHDPVKEAFGPSRIYGGGNGFWIEHDDGTRAEYAHFATGTVPSELCPHDDALLPQAVASPAVTAAWPHIRVPEGQRAQVRRGQLLGRVGNTGTGSAPHLHIHVEQGGQAGAVKSGGSPVEIDFARGLSAADGSSPYTQWASFAGEPIPAGPVLVWPPRSLGGELASHAFPAERFGAWFQHLADSGYWLDWIDVYGVGGKSFINQVWRPAEEGWLAVYLTDGATYQNAFDDAKAKGFSPVQVESSLAGGAIRYTAVFRAGVPQAAIARHGLTHAEHLELESSARSAGYAPVSISVVSRSGARSYTVLYRKEQIGTWQVEPAIPEASYQSIYEAQAKAGRRPVYLNAYMHQGTPMLSAVFASQSTAGRKDRHRMSAAAYQEEFESALAAGLGTRVVTSFDGATSQHRFAASWWRDRVKIPKPGVPAERAVQKPVPPPG